MYLLRLTSFFTLYDTVVWSRPLCLYPIQEKNTLNLKCLPSCSQLVTDIMLPNLPYYRDTLRCRYVD